LGQASRIKATTLGYTSTSRDGTTHQGLSIIGIMIERSGKPTVVLIPMDVFEQLVTEWEVHFTVVE